MQQDNQKFEYEEGIITKFCPICQQTFVDHRVHNPKENKFLLQRLREEHPDKVCPECTAYMKKGIIVITFSQIIGDQPVRSGGFFVLEEDGIKLLLRGQPSDIKAVLEKRVLMISDDQAKNAGLYQYLEDPQRNRDLAKKRQEEINNDLVPGLNDME